MKKIICFLLFVTFLLNSQDVKKKPITLKYRTPTGSTVNEITEHNLLIESILTRVLILSDAYEVVFDYTDESGKEFEINKHIRTAILQGLYNKEQTKTVRTPNYKNSQFYFYYSMHFDYDENNNKIYYLTLSLLEKNTNKDIKTEQYKIEEVKYVNNLTSNIWGSGLKFFRLPFVPYKSNIDTVLKDYNDKTQWGNLKLQVSEDSVRVLIDDEEKEINVLKGQVYDFSLYKGEHTLLLEKEGFVSKRLDFSISPQKETKMDVILDPSLGILVIKLKPALKDVAIRFEDKVIGKTSVLGLVELTNFPSGNRKIILELENYKTKEIDVMVKEKTFRKIEKTIVETSLEYHCCP